MAHIYLPCLHPISRTAFILAAALASSSCGWLTGIEFDPDKHAAIPQLEELDGAAVQPAEVWQYWELREGGPGDYRGLASGGSMDKEDLDPAVAAAVDNSRASNGFGIGCPPGYCFYYLVAVASSAPVIVTTRGELREFLGAVTSIQEAALLVGALDYVRWDDGDYTGYRTTTDGWDLVVFELTGHCQPVQTDRVRFRVDSHGTLTEVEREVWDRDRFACI